MARVRLLRQEELVQLFDRHQIFGPLLVNHKKNPWSSSMVLVPKITLLSPEEINRLDAELKQLPEVKKVVMDTEVLLRNLTLGKLSDTLMALLFWSLLSHWLLVIFGASYLIARTLSGKPNLAKAMLLPKQFLIYGLGSGLLAVIGIGITEWFLHNHGVGFNGLGIIERIVAAALPTMVAYLAAKTAATTS